MNAMNVNATAVVSSLACLALTAQSAIAAEAPESDSGEREENALHSDSRVAVGYQISPVELDLRGKDRALVGLGSYIVNALGACNDCHTEPPFEAGGNPFEGETEIINTARFLAGGRQFGPIVSALTPPVTSTNITPDEDGRPAGLTFEEFDHVMRTGRDNGRIQLVMPWHVYSKMTRLDMRAIYEYLRAVPSLPDTEEEP